MVPILPNRPQRNTHPRKTEIDLTTDHIPIIITYTAAKHMYPKKTTTFTNYKKANWTNFTHHIETHLTQQEITNAQSLNSAINSFTKTINKASNLYIPKGYRKHYNPSLTPEICNLIKQRNQLRQQRSHTADITIQLNTLNEQISTLISNHKTDKFKKYLQNNLTNPNDKRTWQVIKRLHNSQNNPPTLNEALKENNNTLPSPKQHCNILAQHYSNISYKPTHNNNRKIIRQLKHTHLEQNPNPPFSHQDTIQGIKTLKKSPATGPDNISNLHLKHLGPIATTYLTQIFNKSYTYNFIPAIWKKAIITPKLKPRKDPNLPSSYRPISPPIHTMQTHRKTHSYKNPTTHTNPTISTWIQEIPLYHHGPHHYHSKHNKWPEQKTIPQDHTHRHRHQQSI